MTREKEIKQASEEVLGTIEYQCGFADGARWADKTMLEKALNWIHDNLCYYDEDGFDADGNGILKDFKQAMEE